MTIWLDYLTTKPQGPSCLCLLSTRVTGATPPAFGLLLFLWVLGIRLRSVSCGGSVLLNESFVQPQEIPFLPTCHIHGWWNVQCDEVYTMLLWLALYPDGDSVLYGEIINLEYRKVWIQTLFSLIPSTVSTHLTFLKPGFQSEDTLKGRDFALWMFCLCQNWSRHIANICPTLACEGERAQ